MVSVYWRILILVCMSFQICILSSVNTWQKAKLKLHPNKKQNSSIYGHHQIFVRYFGVYYTFGLLDCVVYNEDFVILRLVITRFVITRSCPEVVRHTKALTMYWQFLGLITKMKRKNYKITGLTILVLFALFFLKKPPSFTILFWPITISLVNHTNAKCDIRL